MANITLFPEQNLTDFTYYESDGFYGCEIVPPEFELAVGKTYIIEWDGVQYECVAKDASAIEPTAVGVGNLSVIGLEGNTDAPFIIGSLPALGTMIFSLTDSEPTEHTLAIYKQTESEFEEESAGIVIKNYFGTEVEYKNVEKVLFNTSDGGTRIFSMGEAIENVDIELNFANGNQVVEAPKGYLVKKATIAKPADLIPENIAEGINIAGIIGTLSGGGGEKFPFGEIVYNNGTVTPSSTGEITISHGLIVLPDIVAFYYVNGSLSTNSLTNLIAFNPKLWDKQMIGGKISTSSMSGLVTNIPSMYESTVNEFGNIHDVTPTSFKVSGGLLPLSTSATYGWIVAGGLMKPIYFSITLRLDGKGNLIVSGGVPEISHLQIFVDGALAKTVDYIHDDTFIVDISDVAGDYKSYTISVKAEGDSLEENYPMQFYTPVTGYTVPRNGTCGANVKWYLYDTGELVITGNGAMDDYSQVSDQPWYSYVSQIKSLTVENGVTHIGNRAFYSCTALKNVTLAETIININTYAFYGCSALTSIDIPDSVIEMGEYVFRNCTSLKDVKLPNNITLIKKYFFCGCTALASIDIPDSVEVMEGDVFNGCKALTNIVIPEGVTSIGNGIFNGCTKLATVSLPSTLTTMGNHIFCNCTTIKTVTIPAAVNSIGQYSCQGASALTSLIFENSSGWYRGTTVTNVNTSVSSTYMGNPSTAATYFKSTYLTYYWRRR